MPEMPNGGLTCMTVERTNQTRDEQKGGLLAVSGIILLGVTVLFSMIYWMDELGKVIESYPPVYAYGALTGLFIIGAVLSVSDTKFSEVGKVLVASLLFSVGVTISLKAPMYLAPIIKEHLPSLPAEAWAAIGLGLSITLILAGVWRAHLR